MRKGEIKSDKSEYVKMLFFFASGLSWFENVLVPQTSLETLSSWDIWLYQTDPVSMLVCGEGNYMIETQEWQSTRKSIN